MAGVDMQVRGTTKKRQVLWWWQWISLNCFVLVVGHLSLPASPHHFFQLFLAFYLGRLAHLNHCFDAWLQSGAPAVWTL